jgi:DEAD/DEAH box helicase domain-containing protein
MRAAVRRERKPKRNSRLAMIPSVVARQIRETVLDYLRTTFSLSDPDFEAALFEFLDSEGGMFKGPYVDVRLPFRKAESGQNIPLDIAPEFDPYKHQLKAFQRLYSREGHQPQHTLVTTGTGSGKTECFLYPILDHCWRNRAEPGVKAIILYPMNALATDQSRRLARMLFEDDRLRGQVTAGLYVGGEGQHGVADAEHLVDKRDILRQSPPDILLTNYRMLDFLLLRPEDARIWGDNTPETLRYLVLDELHTYDGAQGSDVACLIRRLKLRLGSAPGSVCSVGTSATIGSGKQGEAVKALTEFASKVFDESFFDDGVIVEDRCTAVEVLGGTVDLLELPDPARGSELATDGYHSVAEWLASQAEIWLGEGARRVSPVELGRYLERHEFLRQILSVLSGSPSSWGELDAGLRPRVPEWESLDVGMRRLVIESFLGLVSHARRTAPTPDDPDRTEPFLTVQTQLWLRELRHLVQGVSKTPGATPVFAWAGEGSTATRDDIDYWLPIAHCRDCGTSGLATVQRQDESKLGDEASKIGLAWLQRSRMARFVAWGHGPPDEGFPEFLCPECLRVQLGEECDNCKEGAQPLPTLSIRVSRNLSDATMPRFLARCPECGGDGALSMMGSRAASLLSVAISHLFQTEFNNDKKLLAFTDSVQDASHRAGFFGARTYRFNLRTAMQSAIEASDGLALSELGGAVWKHWLESLRPEALAPALLPSDLVELDSYLTFVEDGGTRVKRNLEADLLTRLSWEAVMEFGLNTRVGRTLEGTRCATVAVDPEALDRATEVLGLELSENPVLSEDGGDFDLRALRHFLAGLLWRTRVRGGIHHDLLRTYAKEEGKWFFLTKRRQRLMSPFHSRSPLPRFVTDRTKTPGRDMVFDTIISSSDRHTWMRDWAERVLGVDRKDPGINQLYREALRRLEDAGLLVRHDFARTGAAWAVDPARLSVTASVGTVRCRVCRHVVVLASASVEGWLGQKCTHYRCTGLYEAHAEPDESYYARIYRSGRMQRIYSQEHTGLIERAERERIEEEFSAGTKPGAPNLFVCTPTLEMGIDIGDLSATVLCSVPPTTSNYLQRVGRAGRKTGNAFTLTLANSRPHDLYFHAEPMELLAGAVLPPGCFLDAPDMLKRQLVAHAMDAWARQEDPGTTIPRKTGIVLSEQGGKIFPGRFITYYRANEKMLTDRFLKRFDGYLSDVNKERLSDFASGETVPEQVLGAFAKVQDEINDHRARQKRTLKTIQDIENNPDIVADPETEKAELEDTRKILGRLTQELRQKYPLNVLTDEGVLPNYAFPEPGVKFESVVSHKRENGGWEYEPREYMRAASSAIRELAPFNTFYADGRKVRIDEIDIGTKVHSLIEMWRLCAECSYMRREFADQDVERTCPRCEDAQWADAGQARELVHFRRSRSLATRLESSTVDDTDDRQSQFYQTHDLIDVGQEHYNGAKLISDLPFGFELLKNLTLREINFGLDRPAGGHGLHVCGQLIGDKGFETCVECGRVRESADDEIRHSPGCKARKTGVQAQVGSFFLYREIESEALRVLLPVSAVDLDEKRASFKGALQLGFRRYFQGDPGHLIIRSVREPVPGGYGVRQYLVVFDGVPGGTGYLSELWQGEKFLDVLQMALDALRSCECRKSPDKDGCYRCLYAYQSQRDLNSISSRSAEEILTSILDRRETLETATTLSEVSLDDKLESELEVKFLRALEARADESTDLEWDEKIQGGEIRWTIRVGDFDWEILPQVPLGASEGVLTPCRPDFIIRGVNADPTQTAIAVFLDGLAYHACPGKERGRVWDDIEKRTGILASGKYAVWSITWKDVEDFEKGPNTVTSPEFFAGLNDGKLGAIVQAVGETPPRGVGMNGSMQMLLSFLGYPKVEEWERLATAYAMRWISDPKRWVAPEAGAALEARLLSQRSHFLPGPMAQVGADTPVFTRPEWNDWLSALGRTTPADLQAGKVERLTFRLFDEQDEREDAAFEGSWRSLLQAWNLMQFHAGTAVVSSEMIEQGNEYRVQEQPRQKVAETLEPDLTSEFQDLLVWVSPQSRELLLVLVQDGLSLPTADVELPAAGGAVGPEADMAWPSEKVAVLVESQEPDRAAFEAAGWTVFTHPVVADELAEAVRAASNEDTN